MTAQDVKDNLETLMQTGHYVRLFTMIEEIELVHDFHLILKFNKRPQFFEYRLASRYSSIYKTLSDGSIIGSGPYHVYEVDDTSLHLMRNVFYRGHPPDIPSIILTTNKKTYEAVQEKYTQPFSLNTGYEFLLFNPHKKHSIGQRKYLSGIILSIVEKFSHTDLESEYKSLNSSVPKFDSPLKVIVNDRIRPVFEAVQQRLLQDDIELLLVDMDYETYLNTHLITTDIDFCWMFEAYHEVQPYSVIDLLTQCKFQEWYGEFKEAQDILNNEHHDSNAAVGRAYLQNLQRKQLFVPIFTNTQTLYFTQQMKNLQAAPYGTFDYRLVVNDIE